jgi:hypothetical protein
VGRPIAWLLAAVLCCALAAGAGSALAGKHRPYQRVTIFSDSVGAALNWDSTAHRIVEEGNRVLFELHPCGRLVQPGCISPAPPSVLAVVRQLGTRIGPNVVVFIGYNDNPATYRAGIPDVLSAMRKRGVQHVLWLTLQPVYAQYRDINGAIADASRRYQGFMTMLAWGAYSHDHPSWFSPDGIHMTGIGASAFATYLHDKLKALGLTGPKPLG